MARALLIFTLLYAPADEDCRWLESVPDAREVLAYLEVQGTLRDSPHCFRKATRRLWLLPPDSRASAEQAMPVLLRVLDYQVPSGEFAFASNRDQYPARSAIIAMKDAALPYLVDALASDELKPTARENALYVYLSIHGEQQPDGIRQLRREGLRRDDDAARRLAHAVRQAPKYCYRQLRTACIRAARGLE